MLKRHLAPSLIKLSRQYPIVSIVGPRQSGKTTLAKLVFPKHQYVSLENLDYRTQAQEDPRGFLADFPPPVILDEIQRVPSLFSYLQEKVDTLPKPAQYILTGSQQFLLMEKISQSLAGRIATVKLFPFSYQELQGRKGCSSLEQLLTPKKNILMPSTESFYRLLFTGLYPRIHDQKLEARKWLENYVATYVERDIRSLINISSLRTFESFLKILASFSGQLLNYTSLSNQLGLSQPTMKSWLSLLETSGIVYLLSPHYKNFTKRLIKAPKVFFVDTGLLCFLLSIRNPTELKGHPLLGNIFETFVISELYKNTYHMAETPPFYFWRDKSGLEIDLLVELGSRLFPIEIKSAKTYKSAFNDSLVKWFCLKGNSEKQGMILYGGDKVIGRQQAIKAVPWWMI